MRKPIFIMIALALVILAGAVTYRAEAPKRLDEVQNLIAEDETIAIELPHEAQKPEPPKPETSRQAVDDLLALAPESFQTQQLVDTGFGASYGSGGGGPAIGGQGGFGAEGDSLISQSAGQDRLPRVISRGVLDYPVEAKSKGIQGYVVVKIQVGPAGNAEDVRIAESQPAGFFDHAVLNSVRTWKFEPGLVAGKVASAWISQKVRFELD